MKKQLILHLISDSTGETLGSISRAVLSRFDGIECHEKHWFLIRTEDQIFKVLDDIKSNKDCIVLYTMLHGDLEKLLVTTCESENILCIPAISHIIQAFSEKLNLEKVNISGRQHIVSNEYYSKMEAINYTIAHDDGNLAHDLDSADIVLIGASRTSKSPTSVYLAYKGHKVANIPFVLESTMPNNLASLKNPLVVGLIVDPNRLESIRKSRMNTLNVSGNTEYTDIDKIRSEVTESRKFFTKIGCPVINVTQKSVEETAVYILQMLDNKKRSTTE